VSVVLRRAQISGISAVVWCSQSETSLALSQVFQSCPSAAAFLALPSNNSWENTLVLSRDGTEIIKISII